MNTDAFTPRTGETLSGLARSLAEDLPDTDPALERNQLVRLDSDGNPVTEWCEVIRGEVDLAPVEAAE